MRPAPTFAALDEIPAPAWRGAVATLDAIGERPSPDVLQRALEGLALAVAPSSSLERAIAREAAIVALTGKVKAPGRLLDAALGRETQAEAGDAGSRLDLEDPEPWEEPVEGRDLLDEIAETFGRFAVLPDLAAEALALWAVHAHACEHALVSPRIVLTSATKRSGKTTVLELLRVVVPRPLPAANASAAVVYRAVEAYRPTLLVDEADTFLAERDELVGILNSGHRRGGYALRVDGEELTPRAFNTFCPVAIASIDAPGKVKDTLLDRAVVIEMRRRAAGETVERLRLDRLDELTYLRRQAARWAADFGRLLRGADPRVPAGLHDRAADNWRPLLAIADLAGGDWPRRAREAAVALSGGDEDASLAEELLADVRMILDEEGGEAIRAERLRHLLVGLEARPWAELGRGKGLTPHRLARMLRPFGARPRPVRDGAEVAKAYRRRDLEDAFARYLSQAPPLQNGYTVTTPGNTGVSGDFKRLHPPCSVTDPKSSKGPSLLSCNRVTDREGGREPGEDFDDLPAA